MLKLKLYNSDDSSPWHQMELNGQQHTTACLSLGTALVSTGQKAGFAGLDPKPTSAFIYRPEPRDEVKLPIRDSHGGASEG
jgi:hypothetical protein